MTTKKTKTRTRAASRLSRKGMRGGSVPGSPRSCTTCKREGHNKRTCPSVPRSRGAKRTKK